MASDFPYTDSGTHREPNGEQIEEAVARYVDDLTAGRPVDPMQVLVENPGIGHDVLERVESFVALQHDDQVQAPLGTLGDYTLRRQIGRGGMGVVYEAWENSMDRTVALKVLPSGIAADDKAFQRFCREAKLAGKLSHPNVAPVYGMGIKEDTPHYAMEYVEGETLAQVLGRLRDASDDAETAFGVRKGDQEFFLRIARCFADVADGLQHAHSKGVIHRDIKPSNLILDPEGDPEADRGGRPKPQRSGRPGRPKPQRSGGRPPRLRILDFGLARLEGQDSLTISGDVVGTPAYMSPEQAKRQKIPVDHRTDIYSLGATLYELLTHQQPFRGKDHADTLSHIVEHEPRPPRRLNARVPYDLETIVLKCLRKDANDRYRTAEALRQDLRRFVRGDAIEARPERRWERVKRQLWRRRARITSWASMILVLFLVTTLFLQHRSATYRVRLDRFQKQVQGASMKLLLAEVTLKSALQVHFMKTADLRHSEKLAALLPGSQENPIDALLHELEECSRALPERPEAFYYTGKALALLGRHDEASARFHDALVSDPDFFPAAAFLATIDNDTEHGEGAADKALVRDPPRWSSTWRAAFEASAEQNWQDAVAAYTRWIDLERTAGPLYFGAEIEARIGRALTRLHSGDTGGAIEDLALAREEWPAFLETTLLLGRAWYLYGDPQQADRTFRDLLDQDLHEADDVRFWVATTYRLLKDPERGLDWANEITEPAVRERLRAAFLYDLRDVERALLAARAAVRLNPTDFFALGYLATALTWEASGQGPQRDPALSTEVIAVAEKMIELNDQSSFGYECLAFGLLLQRKRTEALSVLQAAVGRFPENPTLRHTLGHTLMKLRKLRASEDELRKTLELDAERGTTWASLGHVLELKEDDAGALEAFSRAIELDPQLPSPHMNRARVLRGQGNHKDAIESFLEYLELRPEHAEVRRELAELLARSGSLRDAEKHLRKAVEVVQSQELYDELIDVLERQGKQDEAARRQRKVAKERPDPR